MKQTIANLAKAFVGECQARNRYTFYASVARKEGYEQMAEVFLTTADQEKQHAKWLLRLINQLTKQSPSLKVEAEVPTVLGTTAENLQAAIAGEKYEQTKMYPEFADTAEKDGYKDIASRLRAIAQAEKHHQERYQKLLKELKAKTVFKKAKPIWWVCRECGYVHYGKGAPQVCPSCAHPQAFYQVMCEKY